MKSMQLRIYMRMLWRGWWLIALATLTAFNVALFTSYRATPMYSTTARFVIVPSAVLEDNNAVLHSLGTLDRPSIAATYVEILASQRVFESALQGLEMTADELEDVTHSAVVLPDSNVLELTVAGPDPELLATLGNSIGHETISYIRQFYPVYDIDFIDEANVPEDPDSPNPKRDAAVALVLGGVMGSVLAILREQIHIPLNALRQRNIFDEVSNVYTRDYFLNRLEEALLHHKPGTLALGLVHLDGFEELSAALPHTIRQTILRQTTHTMHNELHGRDTIGCWGDASFAVLMPATQEELAYQTLDRVKHSLRQPQQIDKDEEPLYLDPVIAGVINVPDETAKLMIDRVEIALKHARIQSTTSLAPDLQTTVV
jgi:diguanylate cyclase (GGDEF)-like protein